MALGGMLLGALLLLGRQPLVSLGILWFFTGHLMESTVIGLELAHEHRNYLADYGIILAITALIAQAPLRKAGSSHPGCNARCFYVAVFIHNLGARNPMVQCCKPGRP